MGVERTKDKNIEKVKSQKSKVKSQDKHDFRLVTRDFRLFSGFTLIEVLIGTAIFLIVAGAAYGAFVALLRLANVSQANILAVELADEQFETIRNMPYTNVGLTNGIPQGVLPQTQTLVRGGFTFTVTLVIRAQNLSTSTVQASSKLIEVDVACTSCQGSFTPVALTGQVSPANLQSAGAGGALTVNIFDSNANPVQGATVIMQSTATSSITDNDITNNNGILNIIGVPAGYQVYNVTSTKSGYSTATTSPNLTIVNGQLTSASLEIDKLSTLTISSVSPTCTAVPNFNFNLTGTKTFAGNLLFSQNLVTNSSGSLTLNSMIPDTYTLLPKSGSSYDINGITPFSPFVLNAGSTQNLQLVVVPASENSLMVSVQTSTGLPISGATVKLTGPSGYNQTYITGQGYFDQTDWSGPNTSQTFSYGTSNEYAQGSGVDTKTASSSGSILLFWGGTPPYNTGATGTLESSTFDTGTTSNFYSLNWTPLSQYSSTSVAFQFATSPSSTGPWNYLGPNGSGSAYYSSPGMQISSVNNNAEYARYKAYLTTKIATVTPSINDVSFTYTSGCLPPGQVIFQGLSTGSSTLTVSKSGYTTYTSSAFNIVSGWQSKAVQLIHS
jgi:prepilin-type N-terminal cleavage/methylation domain-containing protein